MRKTYKYRLYPNKRQRLALGQTLEICRELYNDALQERRDAWKTCRISLNYYDQAQQLPPCKRVDPTLGVVFSQVLQDVLRRVDKTYKSFFRRGYGFPRFRSRNRHDSFTYPQLGFGLAGRCLQLSRIGNIKTKLHRPVAGQIKTVTLKRETDRWYACFSCVVEPQPLPVSQNAIGIDLGLESFAVTSDGEMYENPRWFCQAQAQLRRAQRKVARRKKGSHRRGKAVSHLAKIHKHVFHQRQDFHHKLACDIVRKHGVIFVEEANVKGLARGMLAKSFHDAGWGAFLRILAYKAECAGRWLRKIPAMGTSQRCPCGNPVAKKLAERFHRCSACGLDTSRDHAAALEILRLGLSLQAVSTVSSLC